MTEIALIILFTIAIAIGWVLGRKTLRKKSLFESRLQSNQAYFDGLNYLLKERPDKAVEAFIQSLEVNSYTLETHLSLGKLMRKQGQVDRAIRIHQNLLARPSLEEADQHQVHLELARDFMSAGLLDRAEMLLQEVIQESSTLQSIAQRYLLDIYQDESEWKQAIDVANSLLQSKYVKSNTEARRELTRTMAHFYCELTQEALDQGNVSVASQQLQQAIAIDKFALRVVMMSAEQDISNDRLKQAIKLVGKLQQQSPAWFFACLPSLLKAYIRLDEENGFRAFVKHVEVYLEEHESIAVLEFVIGEFLKRMESDAGLKEQLLELLTAYYRDHPGLESASRLMEMHILVKATNVDDAVLALHTHIKALLDSKKHYHCEKCGFSGRQLHWRCPSCKHWDTQIRNDQYRLVLES